MYLDYKDGERRQEAFDVDMRKAQKAEEDERVLGELDSTLRGLDTVEEKGWSVNEKYYTDRGMTPPAPEGDLRPGIDYSEGDTERLNALRARLTDPRSRLIFDAQYEQQIRNNMREVAGPKLAEKLEKMQLPFGEGGVGLSPEEAEAMQAAFDEQEESYATILGALSDREREVQGQAYDNGRLAEAQAGMQEVLSSTFMRDDPELRDTFFEAYNKAQTPDEKFDVAQLFSTSAGVKMHRSHLALQSELDVRKREDKLTNVVEMIRSGDTRRAKLEAQKHGFDNDEIARAYNATEVGPPEAPGGRPQPDQGPQQVGQGPPRAPAQMGSGEAPQQELPQPTPPSGKDKLQRRAIEDAQRQKGLAGGFVIGTAMKGAEVYEEEVKPGAQAVIQGATDALNEMGNTSFAAQVQERRHMDDLTGSAESLSAVFTGEARVFDDPQAARFMQQYPYLTSILKPSAEEQAVAKEWLPEVVAKNDAQVRDYKEAAWIKDQKMSGNSGELPIGLFRGTDEIVNEWYFADPQRTVRLQRFKLNPYVSARNEWRKANPDWKKAGAFDSIGELNKATRKAGQKPKGKRLGRGNYLIQPSDAQD